MTKKEPSSASPAKPRTVFTDQFKREAVARLRARTQPATDLALELGIRRNQLYKWAKQIDESPADVVLKSPGRPPEADESEVVRLRRELAQAKEELEILKKFDAYLTRPGK
jgi:transposase